jgi:putative selenium metabolism hydrolase
MASDAGESRRGALDRAARDPAELLEIAQRARRRAARLEDYTVQLLRDLIAIPSQSGDEARVADRIGAECDRLGIPWQRDRCGSVIATLGGGGRGLVYDAHIDTVGPGDLAAWSFDPYAGKVADGAVWGRGASDNKGAVASMLTGMRIMGELGLAAESPYCVQLIGVVEEEVLEGWAIGEAIASGALRADMVVLGECTALELALGHRGRCEFTLEARGVACHGSSPWRGHSAIYDLAAWVGALREGAGSLPSHPFLGPASLAVTALQASSGSPNVVPELARATVDRRTIPGETAHAILGQLLARAPSGALDPSVRLVEHTAPSYTGLPKAVGKEYPAWALREDHGLVKGASAAVRAALGREPSLGRWEFSTDGVMTMGRLGIPTIGFGPGEERHAHTVVDQVSIEHLVGAAAVYAVLPLFLGAGAV